MNKSHQASNEFAEKPSATPTMKDLVALSMPTDVNVMLSSVDSILARAIQHIDDSLKLSAAQVEAAKQALLQQHSGLEQAYGDLSNAEQNDKLPETTIEAKGEESFPSTNADSQQTVQSEPYHTKATLEEVQTNIDKVLADMESQLKKQQKQYESKVVAANALAQQALQEKALAKAQQNAEQLTEKIGDKSAEKSTDKSTEKEAEHLDQATAMHKQAIALIASMEKE